MLWKVAGIFFMAILISFIEVPNLLKSKLKKELWVFISLLFVGIGLGIIKSLNLEMPNPLDVIIMIYKPFSDGIYKLLK